MGISKNGMVVYIPYILEQFMNKLDLDAEQERIMTNEQFKKCILHFRLIPDDWEKIRDDLKSVGIIEGYDKHKIFFR